MASDSGQPREYVLDSYAVLAYMQGEAGGGQVADLLEEAAAGRCWLSICVVNLGEVAYAIERQRGLSGVQEAMAWIEELPIEVVDADRPLTLAAAHLKARLPMAYADCFAAAMAQLREAPVVTGDPEFRALSPEYGVTIEWLAG